MANTSSRTLTLLSLLQTHRFWPGTDLADRLGVSVRTLRRDIDRLRELGYPVTAQPGVDGGYQLAPGASLPPLVLTDDEAVALAVGLRGAAQSSVAGVAESSVQALTKVTQVMPARLRRRIDAIGAMTEPFGWESFGSERLVDPDTLTVLSECCRDQIGVEFDYTSADGVDSHRRVEPHRVVSSGRRWYLVAFDSHRHAWRSFRLDRAGPAVATGRRFAPRPLPATDAAEFVRAGLRSRSRQHVVRATVSAPADQVRSRIGRWADVGDRRDGTCTVTMETEEFEWPAFALALTGAEFRVDSPPDFADHLRQWSGRLGRAAAPGDR